MISLRVSSRRADVAKSSISLEGFLVSCSVCEEVACSETESRGSRNGHGVHH